MYTHMHAHTYRSGASYQLPRGSKDPTVEDSGLKHHSGYGFWNQKPQILCTWTLWELCFFYHWILLDIFLTRTGFRASSIGTSKSRATGCCRSHPPGSPTCQDGLLGLKGPVIWVAIKELQLSCHNPETIVFSRYPYYGILSS